ncbi:hypothetical protein [Actinoplanes sp. N902-109]|uniref:hypothetical protein n=1 Tax=Actinoplanes sp. (strain N902-109) TaxID=649831 RepID=UPI0003295E79|nr:hypothetical protein [Actinoplanes sp. N902-109]AGL13851.1 hypothetical protein L083_0341 [Actinoplanes sp. N902-109]
MIVRLKWALVRAGYVVRPYDMLADRRRWFWQSRQRCGWSYGLGRRTNETKPSGGDPA